MLPRALAKGELDAVVCPTPAARDAGQEGKKEIRVYNPISIETKAE